MLRSANVLAAIYHIERVFMRDVMSSLYHTVWHIQQCFYLTDVVVSCPQSTNRLCTKDL